MALSSLTSQPPRKIPGSLSGHCIATVTCAVDGILEDCENGSALYPRQQQRGRIWLGDLLRCRQPCTPRSHSRFSCFLDQYLPHAEFTSQTGRKGQLPTKSGSDSWPETCLLGECDGDLLWWEQHICVWWIRCLYGRSLQSCLKTGHGQPSMELGYVLPTIFWKTFFVPTRVSRIIGKNVIYDTNRQPQLTTMATFQVLEWVCIDTVPCV